jgi:hypothetical protein
MVKVLLGVDPGHARVVVGGPERPCHVCRKDEALAAAQPATYAEIVGVPHLRTGD